MTTAGSKLGEVLKMAQAQERVVPFLGVYDLFSASLAADRFGALFLSGFGLAASAFGLMPASSAGVISPPPVVCEFFCPNTMCWPTSTMASVMLLMQEILHEPWTAAVLHHCFLVIVVACTDAFELRQAVSCSLCCDVIDFGKVLRCSRADLVRQDVQGLIYNIPCLFAAQEAIERALDGLAGETRISRMHYSVIGNSPTATPSCRPI